MRVPNPLKSERLRDVAVVGATLVLVLGSLALGAYEIGTINGRTSDLAHQNAQNIKRLQQNDVKIEALVMQNRAVIRQNSRINARQNALIAALRKQFPGLDVGPLSLPTSRGFSSPSSQPTGHKAPPKHPVTPPSHGNGNGGHTGGTPPPPAPPPPPTNGTCVLGLCSPLSVPKTSTVPEIPHVG